MREKKEERIFYGSDGKIDIEIRSDKTYNQCNDITKRNKQKKEANPRYGLLCGLKNKNAESVCV